MNHQFWELYKQTQATPIWHLAVQSTEANDPGMCVKDYQRNIF